MASENGHHEQRTHAAHGNECGGIDTHGVVPGLVDKAEERGLHAKCQDDEQQGRIAVNLRHDAVVAR